MAKAKLTDEQVMAEIDRLKDSPYVKKAVADKAEQRRNNYNPLRQKMYTLRYLEKRGKELMQVGDC